MYAFFWSMALLLLYVWLVYPFLLMLICAFRTRRIPKAGPYPDVTVVLTVHNEETTVARRLENLLGSDYPAGRFDVLVASDGSSDRTDEIVESIAQLESAVKLIACPRGGKSAAQNRAVPLARGGVIVLTDAGALFEKDTVKNLVRHFADGRVGCVTGRLVLGSDASAISASQSLYWRYEIFLRRLESWAGVLHTASGVAMAFRKALYKELQLSHGDDCAIPLDVVLQGYKVVHDDSAVAYDSFPATVSGEFRARVRMTVRNLTCTANKLVKLNPLWHPLLFLAIVSHKLLRWLTPYFMLGLLVSNALILGDNGIYTVAMGLQAAFYTLGLLGFLLARRNYKIPLAGAVSSFIVANSGFFVGVLRAVLGERIVIFRNTG